MTSLVTSRWCENVIRAILVVVLAVSTVGHSSAAEPITLFNGKNLDGWTQYIRKNEKAEMFTVKDGILSTPGRPLGYVRTNDEYENYVLTLEWRWEPGQKPGNSGVLLHMQGDDKFWPKSIEAQLMDGNAGDIWSIDGTTIDVPNAKERTKGRRIVNLTDNSEKAPGEWNKYEITCKGGEIILKVNGEVVNQGTNASITKGKICLQSEGAPIQFRNIVLTPIEN